MRIPYYSVAMIGYSLENLNCASAWAQQKLDDFNTFFQNSDFAFVKIANSKARQVVNETGFKNQTKLLSPVIFLTDFETDHHSYATDCSYPPPAPPKKKKARKVVFQFCSFPKTCLPFHIVNILIEFSLKYSGFLRIVKLLLARKACL